jgi:DNA-binding transcriptional LysR family regulator
LRIGFISVADYNVLPVVLREFRRHFPLVKLALRESTTDALLRDLAGKANRCRFRAAADQRTSTRIRVHSARTSHSGATG